MIENMVTASTNFVGFYSAAVCKHKGYTTEALYIYTAAFLSFLYHSYESRKHNMPGIFKSPLWLENLLLNLDRTAALSNLIYWQHAHLILERYTALCLSLVYVLMLSELTNYKPTFIILHNVWHIGVFLLPLVVIN